jgi:aflatoxin B1 aldehyde reductase
MAPKVIFGDIRGLDLDELLPVLQKYGIDRLDSAAVYGMGESERRLGEAHFGDAFTIDTKVLTGRPTDGTLTPEKIAASTKTSLDRLKIPKINVLYCHAPDEKTPVAEQAKGFDEVYKQGSFAEVRRYRHHYRV